MSSTIKKIKPETLARIEKQAAIFGLSIDDYLQRLLPKTEENLALKSEIDDAEFENDMLAFGEETDNPHIYDGTYSREDIYFEHD